MSTKHGIEVWAEHMADIRLLAKQSSDESIQRYKAYLKGLKEWKKHHFVAKIPSVTPENIQRLSRYHNTHKHARSAFLRNIAKQAEEEPNGAIYLCAEFLATALKQIFFQEYLEKEFSFAPEMDDPQFIPSLADGASIERQLQFYYAWTRCHMYSQTLNLYALLCNSYLNHSENAYKLWIKGCETEHEMSDRVTMVYHNLGNSIVNGDKAAILNLSGHAFSRISMKNKRLRDALLTVYNTPASGLLQELPTAVTVARERLTIDKAGEFIKNVTNEIEEITGSLKNGDDNIASFNSPVTSGLKDIILEDTISGGLNPAEDLLTREDVRESAIRAQRWKESLSRRERELCDLVELHPDWSDKALAEAMGVSSADVPNYRSRMWQKLKKLD